jgi:hypothetical protein
MKRCLIALCGILLFISCGTGGTTGGPSVDMDGTPGADAAVADGGGDTAMGSACATNDDCPGGFCDPFGGICVECIAADHCDTGETCLSGECLPEGTLCAPGAIECLEGGKLHLCNGDGTGFLPEEDCDDGNPCTEDLCDQAEGCVSVTSDASCDDNNPCTEDSCHEEDGCVNNWSTTLCGDQPLADASPKTIKFGPGLPEQPVQKNLSITNLGLGQLEIYSLVMADEDGVFFMVTENGRSREVTPDDPLLLEPGGNVGFILVFVPSGLGEFKGALVISTNDPNQPDGDLAVPLSGLGVDTNCIEADPVELDFGYVSLGQFATKNISIVNCGDGLVPVYDIALQAGPGDGNPFTIETVLGTPLDLDIGENIVVTIGYFPEEANQVHSATLRVQNGAPSNPNLGVPISGIGVLEEPDCPVAVIDPGFDESPQVLDLIQLDGGDSQASLGNIDSYKWTMVEKPEGVVSKFLTSDTLKSPYYRPTLVGAYKAQLDVWDSQNLMSCEPAIFEFTASPYPGLYVELSWMTPSDVDESDEGPGAGTDLDLHLVHPSATGPDHDGDGNPDGWFDTTYDCFWFNPQPDWGAELVREDGDGAGPESIVCSPPDVGPYKIGVSFWDDHGFGVVQARVRIYGEETLILDTGFVELEEGDLWDVGSLTWDAEDSTLTPPDDNPKILSNYPKPL